MLPRGFLPDEDQGVMFAAVRLPDGASLERTQKVIDQVEDDSPLRRRASRTSPRSAASDFTTSTRIPTSRRCSLSLEPWEERHAPNTAIVGACWRAHQKRFNQIPEAIVFGFGLPPILGLGTPVGSSSCWRIGRRRYAATGRGRAGADRRGAHSVLRFRTLQSSFRDTVPQYKVDLDTDKAQTLGIPVTDVYNALQTFLGGLYVNDFNRFSRTWRVLCRPSRSIARIPTISTAFTCARPAENGAA